MKAKFDRWWEPRKPTTPCLPVRKRKTGPCENFNQHPDCQGWDLSFRTWSDEELAALSGQTMWGPVKVTR